MTPLDIALGYISRGWNPVPVPHGEKVPRGQWQSRVINAGNASKYFNGGPLNIGVMMGTASQGLTDVDLDCPEAVAVAPYILPRTAAVFGRASKPASHWLYVSDLATTARQATIKFEFPKTVSLLELRCGGGGKAAQTVFPGSTHPSGEAIKWDGIPGEPAKVAGAELIRCARLIAACCLIVSAWPTQGGRHDAALTLGGFFARAGLKASQIGVVTEAIARAARDLEWRDRVTAAKDHAQHHAQTGQGRGMPKLAELVDEKAARKIAEWLDYQEAPQPQSRSQPASSAAPQQQTGTDYMPAKTKIACNVGNVLLAFEKIPELTGAFGYDEMLQAEMLIKPLFAADPDFVPRPLTDNDVVTVQKHLQWQAFRRLGKDTTHDAINKYAYDHRYHPVRNYLEGLRWDGKGRLGSWLSTCLGTEASEYEEEIGKMFLISMVARIFQPACKVDYMLILEGGQGLLKSTACGILAGKYFSDHLPDITSKDCFQHMRGKWLIEVAELRAYSRADLDHFKEFLVRTIERYRPPWGRKEVHEPRQCVFIATTNKDVYLRDETGNRRFWPATVGEIDLDRLRNERDQLFAEAAQLYRAGVPWWPDRDFERQVIAPRQEQVFEEDIWQEPIAAYLDGRAALGETVTIMQVARKALDFDKVDRIGGGHARRIAAVMIWLGWERTKRQQKTGTRLWRKG
jgi:hypothetical protein